MVVFSKATTVLLGLATIASAAPMDQPRKAFTVKQVMRPIAQKKTINIAAMYAHSLSKFGADIPQSVKHAASSGSAVTTPEQDDSEYLTPVNVGGTTLNLDFDTGSADLWVFSNELSSSQQGGHSIYKPASNATKLSGYHWQIYYGDGSSASGDVYEDTVSVGGLTVYNQAVEAANRISSQFVQDKNNDGLFGLAFSSLNTVRPQAQKTFFDTVISELDAPLFAVSLKYHAPGSYDFGFIDKSKHNGSLTYANVDKSQGWWQFTTDGYGVGDSVPNPSPIKGIVDTGTTLLLLADDIVDDYYRQVPQASNDYQYGGYIFPCTSQLPMFSIVIGSYKAVIPGEYINYAPVSEGSTTCFGGIQSNQALGVSIFGDIFLKSQYVVFDSQGPKLGFAPQA